MKPVVVNDASCLIEVRKGGLLELLGRLPYRPMVPLPVRVSEILDFSRQDWRRLDDLGMITHDLTPTEVGRALEFKGRHRALSANDCFCLVTALVHRGILLTGDARLRKVATDKELRVHGVLWLIDELASAKVCPASVLAEALRVWRDDPTVFLPPQEVSGRLDTLRRRG